MIYKYIWGVPVHPYLNQCCAVNKNQRFLFAWAYQLNLPAIQQCFYLTINQPIVFSVMAYQSNDVVAVVHMAWPTVLGMVALWVSDRLPSMFYRTLGKDLVCLVPHSANKNIWQRDSLSSVMTKTLGKLVPTHGKLWHLSSASATALGKTTVTVQELSRPLFSCRVSVRH